MTSNMVEPSAPVDENAFGLLMSYLDIEEDEYAQDETDEFVLRFQEFERIALGIAVEGELPPERQCVCFGHAVYVEFPDPEESRGLFAAVRRLSSYFTAAGFRSVIVLSHGGRWVEAAEAALPAASGADPKVIRLCLPSEPLRRALAADAGARGIEGEGWGAGVYVDTEALEALKMTPKNAPTVLCAGGATFLRVPALPVQE